MDSRSVLVSEKTNLRRCSGPLRVCLVYPNKYEVGMANLGFQLLYRLLSTIPRASCERSFLDAGPGRSLESQRPLAEFDLLAFSLPYELDFFNILTMLRDSQIPLTAEHRAGHPLLLLGGVAPTANPLPYSTVFDVICLGEAEENLREFINNLHFPLEKSAAQSVATAIPGLWVPGSSSKARRVWVSDLDGVPSCAPVVTPFSHFRNMLLVDVERGCPFGCRFCLARQAYAPYRARSVDLVFREIVDSQLSAGGVGLVGAGLSEVPGLGRLVAGVRRECEGAIGVSSLRLDRIDRAVLRGLVGSGLRTISIAPEAGTERLRWVLDKRITDEEILSMGPVLDRAGVRRVRLYFMVGLPFEREKDIVGIVELVSSFRSRYSGGLLVSVNPFVPKAQTPFQYHGMEPHQSLARKIAVVKRGLGRLSGTRVISKSPRQATVQGVLSVGDLSVGPLMIDAVGEKTGWQSAFKAALEVSSSLLCQKDPRQVLPWDFIDFGVERESLWEGYVRAQRLGMSH